MWTEFQESFTVKGIGPGREVAQSQLQDLTAATDVSRNCDLTGFFSGMVFFESGGGGL